MVDGRRFVSGTAVDWRGVARLVAGSWLYAITTSAIAFMIAYGMAARALVWDLGTNLELLVTTVTTGIEGMLLESWASAGEFLELFGVLAYPLAMLITMATLYVASRGVSELVE